MLIRLVLAVVALPALLGLASSVVVVEIVHIVSGLVYLDVLHDALSRVLMRHGLLLFFLAVLS